MDLVYEPLRALAQSYFRRQPDASTLQPTALVHEVYLRMVGKTEVEWQDRAHFFAICATAMRGILADHARRRRAAKRGGDRQRVTLSGAALPEREDVVDLLDLDEALMELAALSERQARIVEYRLFAGMTVPEIAHALGVSKRTVDNDWAMARAWIGARLSEAG
jgi:RNA polymerase sigma factor (TIGR02999 family)